MLIYLSLLLEFLFVLCPLQIMGVIQTGDEVVGEVEVGVIVVSLLDIYSPYFL